MPTYPLTVDGKQYPLTVPDHYTPEETHAVALSAAASLRQLSEGGTVGVVPAPPAQGAPSGAAVGQAIGEVPSPAEPQLTSNPLGRNVGGMAAMLAGAAGGARLGRPFGLPGQVIGGLGGAIVGGMGGGAAGEAVTPSTDPLQPREMRVPWAAAQQGQQALNTELVGQVARVFPGAGKLVRDFVTPTGRAARAGRVATEVGPKIRDMASNIGEGLTEDASLATKAKEYITPKRIEKASDILQGPPPTQPPPVTSPILAPVGRGMGAEPIVTQPPTPKVPKLTLNKVPENVQTIRNTSTAIQDEAQRITSVLQPIQNAVGNVQTVRLLARNPDAAKILIDSTSSPADAKLIKAAIESGRQAGRENWPRGFQQAMRYGSGTLGFGMAQHLGGGGFANAAGVTGGVLAEEIALRTLNRALNNPMFTKLVSGATWLGSRVAAKRVQEEEQPK